MLIEFKGKRPKIARDVFVAENAVIIGDVVIEEGASIWFGAVLRGDIGPIRVGKKSNIQDNAVVHVDEGKPCIIGSSVTVGHSAILHSAKIGDNTLIGMGAVLLTGAIIGSNCVVGAKALVLENATIPENTLAVGMPAKALRAITYEERHLITENANHYEKLAKEYKERENS